MNHSCSNCMPIMVITILLTLIINNNSDAAFYSFMDAGAGGSESYSFCEKRIYEKEYLDYFRIFKNIFMSANQIDSDTFDKSVKFNIITKNQNEPLGRNLIVVFIIVNNWFNEAETHEVWIPMLIPENIPELYKYDIWTGQKRNEYLTEDDIKEYVENKYDLKQYAKAIKGTIIYSSKNDALKKLASEMKIDTIINRSKYDPREEIYLGQPTLSKWIRVEGEKNHCREYKLNLFTSETSFRDSPCAVY